MRLLQRVVIGMSGLLLIIGFFPFQVLAQEEEQGILLPSSDERLVFELTTFEEQTAVLFHSRDDIGTCKFVPMYKGETQLTNEIKGRSWGEQPCVTTPETRIMPHQWRPDDDGKCEAPDSQIGECAERVFLLIRPPADEAEDGWYDEDETDVIDVSAVFGLTPFLGQIEEQTTLFSTPNLSTEQFITTGWPQILEDAIWWPVSVLSTGEKGWLSDNVIAFLPELCVYSALNSIHQQRWQYSWGLSFPVSVSEGTYILSYQGKTFEDTKPEGQSVYLPNWWTGPHSIVSPAVLSDFQIITSCPFLKSES